MRITRASTRDLGLRTLGFSLSSIAFTLLIVSIGVVGVAGSIVSVASGTTAIDARSRVLDTLERTLEEVKAADPSRVAEIFDGTTRATPSLVGAFENAHTVSVSVDSTTPKLASVSLTASWYERGESKTIQLEFLVYSRAGQCSGESS